MELFMARCLCERLYGVWSVERRDVRSGETRVYGKRCQEVGMLISLIIGCQYLDVSIRDQERPAHWHPAVPVLQ